MVAEGRRSGIRSLERVGERADRVEGAADEDEHGRSDAEIEELGDGDDADPAERDEDERGQPRRCVDPEEVEHEARSRAGPDDDEDRIGQLAVEGQQRERRVRPGNQEEDRRVVEPPHPLAHARRTPRDTVVERADAEHGRERGGVDPRRNQLSPRIRDRNEHNAGDDRDVERVLVEDPAEDAASRGSPPPDCALHSTQGAVSSVGRAGDF